MSFDIKEYHEYEKQYGEQLNIASSFVLEKLGNHDVAVVMGSGLNEFYEEMENKKELLYKDIPNMPMPSIQSHQGKLVSGVINGRKILCFAGRVHSYEGISFHEVCFQVRMTAELGIKVFGLTNATGGTLDGMYPSCIMSIRDHFKFLARIDPLRELLPESILDVSNINGATCWNQEFADLTRKLAKENDIDVFEGVYTWTSGPSFETPLETLMSKEVGGGCLGMSTVPEVLVARACGLEVFGLSCCTNLGAGMSLDAPTHEEVMEMAKKGAPKFRKMLKLILSNVPLPKENQVFKRALVSEVYKEKPFPFNELASSVKIAAGTVMKQLKEIAKVAIIIDKSHSSYLDSISDKRVISFTEIPNFPLKSFPSEVNVIVSGVTSAGERVFVIVCEKIVGFVSEEASFISLILYELGVKFVIMAVVGSRATESVSIKESVVGLKDFTNFTYGTRQFKVLYRFLNPSKEALSEPFISPKVSEYYKGIPQENKMLSFYSYAFPSKAERTFATHYGADIVAITALTPLYTLRFLGIQCVPLVTLPSTDSVTMDTSLLTKGIGKDVIMKLEQSINTVLKNAKSDIDLIHLEQLALPEQLPDKKKYKKPVETESLKKMFVFLKDTLGVSTVQSALIDFDIDLEIPGLEILKSIPLEDVPNLQFHGKKKNARIVSAKLGTKTILAVLGTAYSYEYTSCVDLCPLIRVFHLFGVKSIFMGASMISVDSSIKTGSLVVVKDHINFTGRNPLIGPNLEEWGPRFPDVSSVHDKSIRDQSILLGKESKVDIKEVGLFQTPCSLLYSPNDHIAAKKFHCNVVNSLGVHEVIIAGHSKIPVCYFGLVGDLSSKKSLESILSQILQK